MGLLIFYLLLALVVSFLCSIMEATLLSTPFSFITMKEEEGSKAAKHLRKFKQDIDRPISAILTLNTVANTAGAAGVGKQAALVLGEEWFGWVSAGLTLLILVFSEIIPKTLGANHWRRLVIPMTPVYRALVFLTFPFVLMAEFITRFISPGQNATSVSREEVSAMLKLSKVTAREIMTPSSVVEIADESMTVTEFRQHERYQTFSRIPVYKDDKDDYITGYVLRQTILEKLSEDKFSMRLSELVRPILSFQETESVSTIWERLLEKKEHISVIIDEYGCLRGIVTMEDVIETMLGTEIVDEKDTVTDMQAYAREQWIENQHRQVADKQRKHSK